VGLYFRKKADLPELTPEERDARTVICMQLASRIRSEDLEEFFSSVGTVSVSDDILKQQGERQHPNDNACFSSSDEHAVIVVALKKVMPINGCCFFCFCFFEAKVWLLLSQGST
jgi:hypothetical protein